MVRRKWTQPAKHTQLEIERLVVRFARENGDWSYGKIQGELLKFDIDLSEETIANILERHGIPPTPERGSSPNWRHLMTH